MTRLVGAMVLVASLSAPAAAQEPPVPTPPCESSTQYTSLGIAGKTENVTPKTTPSVGHDITETPYNEDSVTRFFYRLDLSGSTAVPDAAVGDLALSLNWDNRSDFDLYVYDSSGTRLGSAVRFNPQVGPGENLSLPTLAHCSDLRVDVVNYLGLPTSIITLRLSVSNLAPAQT